MRCLLFASLTLQSRVPSTRALEPAAQLAPRLQAALEPALQAGRWPTQKPAALPAAQARKMQQTLFRHRFLVGEDMVLRVPLDGVSRLRVLLAHREAAGLLHTQVEAFRPRYKLRWSVDALRMLAVPNAGGSSLQSEALSCEVLARLFGSRLVMTEMELDYFSGSKITDYSVTLFEHAVGVSVARAINWPTFALQPADAYRLLFKKLRAIQISSRNVLNMRWRKQVLHVWVRTYRDAQTLEEQYAAIPPEVRGNSVVLITLANGIDWIW